MKHRAGQAALLAVFFSAAGFLLSIARAGAGGELAIRVLSTDPDHVTGGDALVEVTTGTAAPASPVRVTVAGGDVTSVFHPGPAPGTLVGLVTGLAKGANRLGASRDGQPGASLVLTNYPITGPVISGPWLEPFLCQTSQFKLPDGSTLGPPLDDNCSAKTVVQYVYRTTGEKPEFKPLSATGGLPGDLARTTTTDGRTVNFIVRVETGTMDRGIYQNAILFDPASDPPPTPLTPPKGWNRRLIAVHGVGCPRGWYMQGAVMGVNPLDAARLGQGYALFTNTLNHPTNSCNAIVAAEATMMGKEHFIETFGVPLYTISVGSSGGAYTSLQIADAFPGLIDGVNIGLTFPDSLAIAMSGMDAHLLMHYFTAKANTLSQDQKAAIGGYFGVQAMVDAANQAQRTDPVPDRADIDGYSSAMWNDNFPKGLRYHPVENPKGARPTIFDAARNIYGVNPASGEALRPFDNVGVQYGLNALNNGMITVEQFLDLNQAIGGVDADSNYVSARTAGDAVAITHAYQSGLLLSGRGGLASIPIMDNATTRESGGYHYAWFHFAVRDRLRQGNGNSDNMVIWRSTTPEVAQAVFDRWMETYAADKSGDPQRVKVLRAKPREAIEGCYDRSAPPQFIAENLVFSSKGVSKCSELYPVYSNPRKEAGGPLAANILKCQLKPIDRSDYKVPIGGPELDRLRAIFPGGVCDWSKPGVHQAALVPWASWGPSPKNRVAN